MSGLLHSKLFRKNLYKWLFMYIAVMCLVTSVITYSRYISSLEAGDSSRQSKFIVDIENLPTSESYECSSDESITCQIENYRPTKKINFYFKANLTNIEVLADVILRVSLDRDLEIEEIYTVDENGLNPQPVINDTDITEKDGDENKNSKLIMIRVNPEDNASNRSNNIRYYKVVARRVENEDKIYNSTTEGRNIYIGYSAEQITY